MKEGNHTAGEQRGSEGWELQLGDNWKQPDGFIYGQAVDRLNPVHLDETSSDTLSIKDSSMNPDRNTIQALNAINCRTF